MTDEAPIFLIRLENRRSELLCPTFHLLQADGLVTEVDCEGSSIPQGLTETKHCVSSEIAGRLATGTKCIIVDLARFDRMTGVVLGILVSWFAQVRRAGADLVLANPSERVRMVLRITRGDSIFCVFDSVGAARSYLIRHRRTAVSKSSD